MPTWLIEQGFRFGIYAGDCVEPPHVHVRGHAGAAKFWLDPIEVAHYRGYNRRQLAVIQRTIEVHLADFLERWHEFCG